MLLVFVPPEKFSTFQKLANPGEVALNQLSHARVRAGRDNLIRRQNQQVALVAANFGVKPDKYMRARPRPGFELLHELNNLAVWWAGSFSAESATRKHLPDREFLQSA